MIYKKSWKYILVKNNYFYRIKALKNFSNVRKGNLGGYVSSYHNLSQSGNCWIYDYAKVTGDAIVFDNARILEYARVYEAAKVYGNAQVSKTANVCGCAQVYGNAQIINDARVFGYNQVFGNNIIR